MTIRYELHGVAATTARLPDVFATASRALNKEPDDFLPPGYLTPVASYDVRPTARSVAAGARAHRHAVADDEVLVLELADGTVLVSSASRLRTALERSHPELVTPEGVLLLEELRAAGSTARGFFSDAVGGLISRVSSIIVGREPDGIIEAARAEVIDRALLGVTWAGTKALMWAIEKRLPNGAGLFAWSGESLAPDARPLTVEAVAERLAGEPARRPMLVFVHGTASHSHGSFGDLARADRDDWLALERCYSGGIYAFEHPTFSQSPIENACALVEVLPVGAHVSLVSHSRGGLVADLLCLDDFTALIDDYRHTFDGLGIEDEARAAQVRAELDLGHDEQREHLRSLSRLLQERRIVVQRYVRVASPSAGTLLASANLDLFLSSLLTLIGRVPLFFNSPVYAAFKRIVLEIASKRTDAHLVPGIEAMLPDSPLARLLHDAPVRSGIDMAVIAGDAEGGNLLARLGVLLTDYLLFDQTDNDLVVDTPSMLAGIASRAGAKVTFDRGGDVTHFRYFANSDTRSALRAWLTGDAGAGIAAFSPLSGSGYYAAALQQPTVRKRGTAAAELPVVVVLPGIMGTHLVTRRADAGRAQLDRVWFDPLEIATGGLERIAWQNDRDAVQPDALFDMLYGKLCAYLADSHRVECFPYDWRQPLDVLADNLGGMLDRLLADTDKPVRLLAHSMGGLVVRACIHRRRSTMDRLMARDGARFIMLGTPNQGAYSMVENLLGKGDTVRALVRLDLKNDMQRVLDIVAGFRGALQLLPKPGFKDVHQGQSDGGEDGYSFQSAATWEVLGPKVKDLWFGAGKVGKPTQAALDSGSWLWQQDGAATPTLPPDYAGKSIYVYGVARNTACGIRVERGRVRMVGTTRGDGTVTWQSGRIGGVGAHYYMQAAHGDLPSVTEHFGALADLLALGRTRALPTTPPAVRAIIDDKPQTYDAGPPQWDDAGMHRLLGCALERRAPTRPQRPLTVRVQAMDLRFVTQPILVGHYESDPIAGPEALIDREVLRGDLSQRYALGMYPGPLGTTTAVLRMPNAFERQRGTLSGAVVTGLGSYGKPLSAEALTEAVRAGALRYLLQVLDVLGEEDREVGLATLLIGYNSSANLSVGVAVEALVRGVMEANARFRDTTGRNIHIARLDIVELYLDTAITAVYALRDLNRRLVDEAARHGTRLVCAVELVQGEGLRQRLFAAQGDNYWPRLIVTDADRDEDDAASTGGRARCPPGCVPAAYAGAASATPTGALSSTPLADRLRFLHVGQRARAESILVQRQPGLIEQLVRRQIGTAIWDEDFGRTLFQQLVPHDFKDAARQLSRVVLVVDSYTANLPWELMLADDGSRGDEGKQPLAIRTAVVRQFASAHFRRHVRQAMARQALVIGNPSVACFLDYFPGPASAPYSQPPPLDGAEAEAAAVVGTLNRSGYTVEPLLGVTIRAEQVFAALYRRPWRILHVSAHGVYELLHVDGRPRSGVLLSDGLLITAADIASMEVVPELVFLNCCHLGLVDQGYAREGGKLAASIARELIIIGVRCVIVAGWAVNDRSAQTFGERFYENILLHGLSFGEAVFRARQFLWQSGREDITWGAFQAYGDPAWLAEPRNDDHKRRTSEGLFASAEELLDELARQRAELARRRGGHRSSEQHKEVAWLHALLEQRCQPAWLRRADVQSAVAALWRDLGEFAAARQAWLTALAVEDDDGTLPVRDIEKLANIEARLGARNNDRTMIDAALQRLDRLDALTGHCTRERAALRGSALKRLAAVAMQALPGAGSDDDAGRLAEFVRILQSSAAAYRSAEGSVHDGYSPYHALNRLALEALLGDGSVAEARDLVHHCAALAARTPQRSGDPWGAVMQAEAALVESLIDGSLGAEGDIGVAACEALVQSYAQSLQAVGLKVRELDSLFTQMDLLARFADVLAAPARPDFRADVLRRVAQRLRELARAVRASYDR